MPTFNDPVADANEGQQALRGLAHATRSMGDPTQVYSVLGSLSAVSASLSQSLHQLATFHDGPARHQAQVGGDHTAGRGTCHEISWELHRAGEILHQVAAAINHAHNAEATIVYAQPRDVPAVPRRPRTPPSQGVSL